MKQNSHRVPGLPIFAGNVVDSSSGPIKRIRRIVKRTVHSSAGAVSARVDGGAGAEADSSSLRNCNPLVRLSESVLPWKVLAEVGTQRMTKSQPGTSGLEPLPILYKSVEEYVRRWEAAVVSELKASIVSNISAQTFEPGRMIEISNIKSSDPPQSSLIKLSYRLVRSQQESGGKEWAAMDLLLVSPEAINFSDLQSSSKRSANQRRMRALPQHMLCIASGVDSTLTCTKELWEQLRVFALKGGDVTTESGKKINSMFHVYTLGSMTSSWREYMSVFDIYQSKFSSYLLWGGDPITNTVAGVEIPSDPLPPAVDQSNTFFFGDRRSKLPGEHQPELRVGVPAPLMQWMATRLNLSQRSAIRNAAVAVDCVLSQRENANISAKGAAHHYDSSNIPFTLIQGPPGTGKTSTLLGLLNIIHVKEYAVYFEHSVSRALGDEGLVCRNRHQVLTSASTHCGVMGSVDGMFGSPGTSVDVTGSSWVKLAMDLARHKPRVLVTAPSNVAVDNILSRIVEQGFIDGNGQKFFPNVLRLGAGATAGQVKAVTMEGTTESLLRTDFSTLRNLLQTAKNDMIHEVKELFHLQTVLLNMRVAFRSLSTDVAESCSNSASVCAPPGWELRVVFDGAKPYWVDHVNKTTQPHPPQPSDGARKGPESSLPYAFYVLEAMPEYIAYTTRLVSVLESLEIHNIQCRRMSIHLNRAIIGGKPVNGAYSNESRGGARQLIESSVLDEAHIVFTTLNGSGHPSLEGSAPFPVLVVDEAAQCTEPSVLIPLRRGCEHCILVGDPKQLPATVFSADATITKYDRSLFERLMELGCESNLLDTQYRMSPTISAYPNAQFYDGKIFDGQNVCDSLYLPPFIRESGESLSGKKCLKPFLFFNLNSSVENITGSMSRSNAEEVHMCMNLIKFVLDQCGPRGCSGPATLGIGIITPYAEQVREFKRIFTNYGLLRPEPERKAKYEALEQVHKKARLGDAMAVRDEESCPENGYCFSSLNLEINTVDGYQGKEKDIVIISCVRASEAGGIGFLADTRRLNVAVTRAKFGLYIVGHAETLQRHDTNWKKLVQFAGRENCIVNLTTSDGDIATALPGAGIATARSTSEANVDYARFRKIKSTNEPSIEPNLEDGEVPESNDVSGADATWKLL